MKQNKDQMLDVVLIDPSWETKTASAVLMWSQDTAFESFRIKSSPPIPQIYKVERKNNDFIVKVREIAISLTDIYGY